MEDLVSIIVVTFNSEKYIAECLEAIYKTRYQKFEVIVVDNKSSDNTTEIVERKFPKTRIMKSGANLGYGGGNNLGAKEAKGKYLAIINPDIQVSKDWLSPLVTAIKSDKTAVCQPKIMLAKNKYHFNLTSKTTHFLGFEWPADYQKRDYQMKEQEITSFSGSALLIKKEIYEESGGFDDSFFMYFEDGDLSWRSRLLGYKILFVPRSVVYHDYKYNPDENIQTSSSKFYHLERNRLLMMLKNYSFKTLILILPAAIFIELGMNFYFLSHGWGFNKFKGYLWIIRNLRPILIRRINIQKERKISDRKLSQNFKGKIEFKEFSTPLLNYCANPILGLYWNAVKKIL